MTSAKEKKDAILQAFFYLYKPVLPGLRWKGVESVLAEFIPFRYADMIATHIESEDNSNVESMYFYIGSYCIYSSCAY